MRREEGGLAGEARQLKGGGEGGQCVGSTQEVGGSKVFMPIATVDPKDVVLRRSPSTGRGRKRDERGQN